MKILSILIISVVLTGCFDKGPKARLIKTIYENITTSSTTNDPDPAAGTILSWGCDGYTRLNQVADGVGGYSEETVERSPDCGWNPPEAGTVSETRCEDPYTLVTVYNDGEYGFYEEGEERNEECGYIPPVVTPIKEQGDRYDPVVFGYESLLDEEPVLETSFGRTSFEEGQILIHGDGRTGEGVVLIDGEEWQYTIIEEPRCGKTEPNNPYDCQNYFYTGPTAGYIYYGEEDERIVEWEIAIIRYDRTEPNDNQIDHTGIVEEYPEGSTEWNKWQRTVDKYNLAYERSGIFIRYKLVHVALGHYHGNSNMDNYAKRHIPVGVDVVVGWGSSCPDACGCAYINEYFREGSPVTSTSRCGWDTDLHEIGHSVGLAHGPNNSGFEASGYIWPNFGHGENNIFCGRRYGDIMSYYPSTVSHWNSKLTCEEMFGGINYGGDPEAPAGNRDYADAAYHLNRVRYDVSLIHREDDWVPEEDSELQFIKINAQRTGRILVID